MKPIGSPESNTILLAYKPTGASAKTAAAEGNANAHNGDGFQVSRAIAIKDAAAVAALSDLFEQAASRCNLPPALLAAIASRETHCGNSLDSQGWGDHGHAFGICQIDRRSFPIGDAQNPNGLGHLSQVAGILRGNLQVAVARHCDWAAVRQLQAAVAAYNVGAHNIRTLDGMDIGTTHDDYSNDVWARALFFAGLS